jgi:hypothetical protein
VGSLIDEVVNLVDRLILPWGFVFLDKPHSLWEILTFFCRNSINFDREFRVWRDLDLLNKEFEFMIYLSYCFNDSGAQLDILTKF